jgi:RHS repeat-associated protein
MSLGVRPVFLLAVATTLAPAQANLPTSARPLSAGERLSGVLDQIRANLRQLEQAGSGDIRPALREERGKLVLADEAYQAEFSRIESRLRQVGLPPDALTEKFAAWHNFTSYYRQRMDAVLAGFDRPGDLAALRASLGPEATTRRRNGLSDIRPRVKHAAPRTNATPLATDPPTPDDLAATKTVLLTSDIAAKAAEYGNSPSALFAYVYNQIQFAPYYLLAQNSEAVLWSGKGNDADQSTLLIALLRASGIPARYVMGRIQVPDADVINWMGAKDRAGAKALLNLYTVESDLGSGIGFNVTHIWVEAWLDTPDGQAWVPMAPSIKRQTFQPGLILAQPFFDRAAFLSSVKPQLASELYADQIHTAFAQTYPGHDFSELAYTGTIIPIAADTLPSFPYPLLQVNTRAATLPAHTIGLSLADSATGKSVYLASTLAVPEICLQSLTISYTAATPADQKAIDGFGGLAKTPVGLVNLLAQLRLDDVVVATGAVPVSYASAVSLTVTHFEPFQTAPVNTYVHSLVAGENVAETVGFYQIGDQLVASRSDRLLTQLSSAAADDTVRETLSYAGLRYFQRMEIEKQRVFPPLQIKPLLEAPQECATSASLNVTNLFDRPFLATPGSLLIDATATQVRGLDLNNGGSDAASTPSDQSVAYAAEAASSGLENELWEEIALIPAISTIKALQLASQNKNPILIINSANSAALLPTVKAPSGLIQTLTNDIKSGATITISQQAVVFGLWTGFGYIEDLPNAFSYIIQQTNGGTTGDNPAQPMPPTNDPGPTGTPKPTNGTSCSDPVTVSNGNMFQQQIDLNISSRGPAIVLQRTYNSLSAAADSPFGFGWTHSYRMSLKDNQTSVTYVSDSGGVFSFALQTGKYVSPAGLNLALTKDAQGYAIQSTHGTQWRFDTKGVLQTITDRNQNAVQLSYDGSGHLTGITDALKRVVTLAYDANGHAISVQDFANRKIVYAYDAAGNLISATDAAGNRTTYAYYAAPPFTHLLQTVTKPAGNSTSFEYYANGQTARVYDSAGRNMRFLYMPLASQTMYIDPRGFAWSFYYNSLGNVTRMVKGDGNYVDSVYTADAKPASYTDEEGHTTQFTYDALGNVTSITDPLGGVTKLTYEPNFNKVVSLMDARGAVTTYQYDAHGNLTRIIQPLGAGATFTYDSFGELLTTTDSEGNTGSISYDASGNPVKLSDPIGNTTQYQFDSLRRLIGRLDALGGSASLQRDALDRVTAAVNELGSSTSRAFDPNGNLAQTIDANGRPTNYSYDALDNLSHVTDAQGNVTQYSYATRDCGCSADSDLITFQDAAGVTNVNSYDLNQRLTQTADSAGHLTGLTYNGRGDIVRKTDANGNTIQSAYDARGRLIQKTFPDGSQSSFTYDANGNLTSAANANTSLTFTYDALNRIVAATDSRFGKTIQYGYDKDSRPTTLTDSEGGVTAISYDAGSRVVSVTNPSGGSAMFMYDALNRRSSLTYSNGIATHYQYDAASELTAIGPSGNLSGQSVRRRTAGASLPQFTYTYDKNGNPTSITDINGGSSYQFNELNRLTAATHPALNPESYTYDGAGNRLTSASGSNYTYDAAGRLIAVQGVTYVYDANGNLIARSGSSGATTYTYDFENRLTGIGFPDGTSAAYQYDALGRRIEKNVNGTVTNYLYDGANILLGLDQNGAMLARYTHGPGLDRMLTMEVGSQTYFYHSDAIGSVAALTDLSGAVTCNYSYDSFGGTQACTAVANPFAFAGREYDSESGLYYMRARYYDPPTGRFITADPLNLTGRLLQSQYGQSSALAVREEPQQLNSYSYAINNPLVFRDPSGLSCSAPWFHIGSYSYVDNYGHLDSVYPNGDPLYFVNQPLSQVGIAGPADIPTVLFVNPWSAIVKDWNDTINGNNYSLPWGGN